MIEILKAVFFGIIQGITEWLPISSTGHLLLADLIIKLNVFADQTQNTQYLNMFFVVIQFGSILAVALLYFNKLNPFSRSKNIEERKDTWSLWVKVIIGAIPAGIIGVLFDDIIDEYLHGPFVIALTLIIYGVLFIVIESQKRNVKIKSTNTLDYRTALLIGCFQILALIPGTSRSGATILGAVLLGCSRTVAAEFSFFLAVPMMAGASLLKIIKMKVALDSFALIVLFVGTFVSFVVSVVAIKFLMNYVRKHDFKVFGYYRIVLGILVLLTMFL